MVQAQRRRQVHSQAAVEGLTRMRQIPHVDELLCDHSALFRFKRCALGDSRAGPLCGLPRRRCPWRREQSHIRTSVLVTLCTGPPAEMTSCCRRSRAGSLCRQPPPSVTATFTRTAGPATVWRGSALSPPRCSTHFG